MADEWSLEERKGDLKVEVGNGALVSMQTVQHLYNEITGRAEELSKSYSVNHHTSYEDIKQLHLKITQLYEQYNIVSQNACVTLYHLDDQKHVFSSFERFELYDRSSLSSVENIRLEYNFLIVLPKVNKPQSYQIEINLQSRAAFVQRMRAEALFHPDVFFGMFEERTGIVEIKYIDYTVARTFQVAIDSWFKGVTCAPPVRWLKHLKRLSENYSLVFRVMSIGCYLGVCLSHFASQLATSASLSDLYVAGTVTFGGAFLLSLAAGRLGGMLMESVRGIRAVSYLKLTRGDERAVEALQAQNRLGWTKALASLVGAVAANLIAAYLATMTGLAP